MIATFIELVGILSPLERVGAIMGFIENIMRSEFGLSPIFDKAGVQSHGFQEGNLVAHVPGTPGCEHLPCLGLEAHADTVGVEGDTIAVVREGDVVKTDGKTILGADNKAGLAVMFELIRLLKEFNLPHPPLDLLVTVGEETSMVGVREFDPMRTLAEQIICLDAGGNEIWHGCAAKLKYLFAFRGRAGHGMRPERGINATLMAAEALRSAMQEGLFGQDVIGRFDGEGEAGRVFHNVAQITSLLLDSGSRLPDQQDGEGRRAALSLGWPNTNKIPDRVFVSGELRSFSPEGMEEVLQGLQEVFERTVAQWTADADGGISEGSVELMETERPYKPFYIPPDHPLVVELRDASAQADLDVAPSMIEGATHANVFHGQHDIDCALLGTGGYDAHEVTEYWKISEATKAVEVLLNLIAARVAVGTDSR